MGAGENSERSACVEGLYHRLLSRYRLVESLLNCAQGCITECDSHRPSSQGGAEGILTLLSVASMDSLLSQVEQEDDIPFWAVIWDSALGLCRHIWESYPGGMLGVRVLELGCGVGAAGLAAAARGAHVLQLDFSPEALEFARYNAARNALGHRADGLLGDIRTLELHRTFDLIVGSDILYEPKLHEHLLRILIRCLAPGGRALFADPGRRWASTFVDLVVPRGWSYDIDEVRVCGKQGAKVIDILTLRSDGRYEKNDSD